jgi:phenylalanyl-tRNA synthetase beta subunit
LNLILKSIQNQIQTNKLKMYQEYSYYPKIIKDLSFIIDQNISFKEIQEYYMLMELNFYQK